MTVVAFIYHAYEERSPFDCFRGHYADAEVACEQLRGQSDGDYLETMDTESFEWQFWYWQPLYNLKETYSLKDGHHVFDVEGRMAREREWLVPAFDWCKENAPNVEVRWTGSGSGHALVDEKGEAHCHGMGSALITAGYWREKGIDK